MVCTWDTAILIPKEGGEYRVIVLVEVIWKFITIIFDHRLADSIEFHDVLRRANITCGLFLSTLYDIRTIFNKIIELTHSTI